MLHIFALDGVTPLTLAVFTELRIGRDHFALVWEYRLLEAAWTVSPERRCSSAIQLPVLTGFLPEFRVACWT